MHGLNTPFSTTWFLAPYCAWLGYGESQWMVYGVALTTATYLNAGYVFLNRDRKL